MKAEFLMHNTVFPTNYDLLAYWAAMVNGSPAQLGDYFVYGTFRPDQQRAAETTKLLFLHGGLHLQRHRDGGVRKRRSLGASLLDSFGQALASGTVPLFASEGGAADKLRAIRRSDYLSFGLEKLESTDEPFVIFGHFLDRNLDGHLIDAINRSPCRLVSVSMILLAEPVDAQALRV